MITARGYIGLERAVRKYEAAFLREVKRVIAETAELAVSQMKALAPVDTGHLKRSVDITYSPDGFTATIIVGANYAIYIEYGSGIYAIHGDGRKDAWVYYVPGGYIDKDGNRAFYVRTRGNRAQPFFTPAMEVAAEHFERAMNNIDA